MDQHMSLDELNPHIVNINDQDECNGNCFVLAPSPRTLLSQSHAPLIDTHQDTPWQSTALPAGSLSRPKYEYQPLSEGQTRIVQVLPSEEFAEIQLIPADVTLPGVRPVGSDTVADYTALSYCWGIEEPEQSIICNGTELKVRNNVLAAIDYHRNRDRGKTIYLWIDALCIDQDNDDEKARQVTMMMDIYLKASSVTAWIGPWEDLQAIQSLRDHENSNARIKTCQDSQHSERCLQTAHDTFTALLRLYQQPYLTRTWIRQEIFAAKRIDVICGKEQLDWKSYVSGKDLLQALREVIQIPGSTESQYNTSIALLAEAITNSQSRSRNAEPLDRNIFELANTMWLFGVSIEADSIHAILRMGGLHPVVAPQQSDALQKTFQVSYERPINQMYHELMVQLISVLQDPSDLRKLWHYIVRPASATGDIPSWAVDWKRSICNKDDFVSIRKHFMARTRTISTDSPGSGPLDDPTHPLYISYMSNAMLHEFQQEMMQPEPTYRDSVLDQFVPYQLRHRGLPNSTHTNIRETLERISFEPPKILESNNRILEVHARAVNYVAYVSNYTCDLEAFLELNRSRDNRVLGEAAMCIHLHTSGPHTHEGLFGVWPEDIFAPFNPQEHDRKIAILGCAIDEQLALVPAGTKKGDLVVALGEALPMILTPLHVNNYKSQLYQEHDPYEDAKWLRQQKRQSMGQRWYSPYLIGPFGSWGSRGNIRRLYIIFIVGFLGFLMTVIGFATGIRGVQFSVGIIGALLLAAFVLDCAAHTCFPFLYLPRERPMLRLIRRNEDVLDKVTGFNKDFVLQGPVFVNQWGGVRLMHYHPEGSDLPVSVANRPVQTFLLH